MGILTSSEIYILTILLALFIKSFTDDPASQSNSLVSIYQALYCCIALITNLVTGHYCDKVNPMSILFPGLIVSAIAAALSFWVTSPTTIYMILMIILLGIGMPACQTTSFYLTIRHYPANIRGVLTGIFGAIGFMGFTMLSLVGGYLFDTVSRYVPFILFFFMILTGISVIGYLYGKYRSENREEN